MGVAGRGTLARRLTAWYAASALAIVLVTSGIVYWELRRELHNIGMRFLSEKVHILQKILRDRPGDLTELRSEVEWEWSQDPHLPFSARVLDDGGNVLAETHGMAQSGFTREVFPPSVRIADRWDDSALLRTPAGRSYELFAFREDVGSSAFQIRPRSIERTTASLLERFGTTLVLTLFVAAIGCSIAGYEIAVRGLDPLRRVSAMIGEVGSASLDRRIDASKLPGEVAALAESFNAMLDRLEAAFVSEPRARSASAPE